jgi:acetyl-CoA C-acetyltransferase
MGADLIATLEGFGRGRRRRLRAALAPARRAARSEGRFARSVVPVHDIAGLTMLAEDETIRPAPRWRPWPGSSPASR